MKILKKIKNMIRGIHYFKRKLMSSQGAALNKCVMDERRAHMYNTITS